MEEVLTVEEIAEILHIKPNTIHSRSWQKRTGCPLKKIGKRLYAIAEEFWKWFNGSFRR
jgi:hypothetical protein